MTRGGRLAALSVILLVAAFVAALLLERRGREGVPDGASGAGGFDF
jgi:hypothetical protein